MKCRIEEKFEYGQTWYCPQYKFLFWWLTFKIETGGKTGGESSHKLAFTNREECVDWINGDWYAKWHKPRAT